MKCSICKQGEVKPGRATVMLERGESIIVLKNVPAEVCDDCGEYYLTADVLDEATRVANEAIERGAVVEVIRFAA